MPWELLVLATGNAFPLEEGKEYYVGSSRTAHIHLPARDVSGTHALLHVSAGHVRVVDLGSKNGTFLNGKRITAANAAAGDVLAFSSVKAQLLRGQTAPPPSPPRSFVEKESSQTGAFPLVAVEENLIELIQVWDACPEHALETLLTWLITRRRLAACALLQRKQGHLAVIAAQGELPPNLLTAAARLPWPGKGLGSTWEVQEIPGCQQGLCLGLLGESFGLLLVTGDARPTAGEVALVGSLARLALHLAGLTQT